MNRKLLKDLTNFANKLYAKGLTNQGDNIIRLRNKLDLKLNGFHTYAPNWSDLYPSEMKVWSTVSIPVRASSRTIATDLVGVQPMATSGTTINYAIYNNQGIPATSITLDGTYYTYTYE